MKKYINENSKLMYRAIMIIIMFGLIGLCSAQFGGGEGTQDNPYVIRTAEHLNNVRNEHFTDHFIQAGDIDIGVAPYNVGEGWVPLFPPENPFSGTYNGNGFTIFNLTISRVTGNNSLFGRLDGGTIENVHMRDVRITRSKHETGALVSYMIGDSMIRNCSSTGEITIDALTDRHVGGIVGSNFNSVVEDCYSEINITGGERAGGVAGWLNGGHARNCYATGNLQINGVSGGLVGLIQRWGPGVGDGSITNCYAMGAVTGTSQIGGLVGTIAGANPTITNSYSTGRITGAGGGFVGQGNYVSVNNYWDTETSGKPTSAGAAFGRTSAEMRFPYGGEPRTFSTWNFDEIWMHDEAATVNDGYPILYFQTDDGEFAGGEGTEGSPWLITNASHLNNIRNYLGEEHRDKYFWQMANIDLSIAPWNEGWEPIGSDSENSFQGNYDTDGKVIRGLTITEGDHAGLFGFATFAKIKNVGLEDVDIRGVGENSGTLVGVGNNVSIRNCYVTGRMSTEGDITGGFIGILVEDSRVENCWSDVSFTTSGSQGAGFISVIDESVVQYCYNLGSVTSTGDDKSNFGGFISVNLAGRITDCYSRASVSANDDAEVVGGFVGANLGEIVNCYATGRITAAQGEAGGFASVNIDTITNCYWDTQTTGMATSSGGEGRMSAQMTYPYAENTYAGWNFNEIWAPDAIYDTNDGYPVLYYQFVQLFAGGLGTEDSPWQVENVRHLDVVRVYLGEQYRDAHFIQTANINLGVPPWNEEEGWMPIGNVDSPFTANYNGDGHTIDGLTIGRESDRQGLFGRTDGARISSLRLKGVAINGGGHCGGIVGLAADTKIANCFVEGKVSGLSYVGGIVGNATEDSEIAGCYTVGIVSANAEQSRVGGILGHKSASNIVDCYSVAQVIGNESYVGGLVGENGSGNITRSYATGLVRAVNPENNIGGLVGGAQQIQVQNSFWNIHTTGQAESAGGGGGISTPAMVTAVTYVNWNFENVWSIENGSTYPYLSWQENYGRHNIPGPFNLTAEGDDDEGEVNLAWQMVGTPVRYNIYRNDERIRVVNHPQNTYDDTDAPQMTPLTYYITAVYVENNEEYETATSNYAAAIIAPGFAGGSGTEADPFHINSASSLDNIRFFLDAHFIQTADIGLGVVPWIDGEGWEPIGTSEAPFSGSFNGDGFIISNMTINRVSGYNGLFGRTTGALFENINLRDIRITNSKHDTGGLVGYIIDDGLIRNCSSTGEISIEMLSDRHIGGIVGSLFNSRVTDCYSHVNINGGERAGGLVGWINGSHVQNSYATGNLNINGVSGGLVGLIQTWGPGIGNGTITNCYARGSVTGRAEIGGLVGTVTIGGEIITNSFSTGRVNGTGGGFVGNPVANIAINCYWDTETSEKTESRCGANGRLTRQMAYPYDLNETYLRWDFDEIWRQDSHYVPDQNPGANDGYPYLYIQDGDQMFLDAPQVRIEIVEQQGVMKAKISWEAVEDANSYRIFAADYPDATNWGQPIDVVAETEYYHPISDNVKKFFKVVASANDVP